VTIQNKNIYLSVTDNDISNENMHSYNNISHIKSNDGNFTNRTDINRNDNDESSNYTESMNNSKTNSTNSKFILTPRSLGVSDTS